MKVNDEVQLHCRVLNKEDFKTRLQKHLPKMSRRKLNKLFDKFLDVLAEKLKKGETVNLKGFGILFTKKVKNDVRSTWN